MENASKALLMAAGVLIGVLILSLAVFLFMDFGATSKGIYSEVESNQLTQYNAQYTIYSGRNDITIYDIISLVNLAQENNNYYKDYTNFESEYKVSIGLQGETLLLHTIDEDKKQALISNYSEVNSNNGELKYNFKCDKIQYHPNGKVSAVQFAPN